MRGLTAREQIAFASVPELTEELFQRRNEIGVWFDSGKQHYVSELDYAASMAEEYGESEEGS